MIGYVKAPVLLDSTFIIIGWSKMNNKRCQLQSLSCRNNNIPTNLDKDLRNLTLQVIIFVYYRDDTNHLNKIQPETSYIIYFHLRYQFQGHHFRGQYESLSSVSIHSCRYDHSHRPIWSCYKYKWTSRPGSPWSLRPQCSGDWLQRCPGLWRGRRL